MASATVAIAVCNGVAMAGCGWVRFSSDSKFPARACGMAGCGWAMVAAACGCGAGICAAVASAGFAVGVNGRDTVVSAGFSVALKDAVTAVSLGVTVKAWLASDSRFLTEACGMAGCGLAIEILASGGGVVICGAVVSAGIAVAVNDAGLSIGFAVAIKLWPASGSRFSRDSRFLAEVCGMAGCGLAMVAVAFGCGAGICVTVASAGFAVGVNGRVAVVSVGFAIALKGTATAVSFGATVELWLASGSRDSRDSRFLTGICGV